MKYDLAFVLPMVLAGIVLATPAAAQDGGDGPPATAMPSAIVILNRLSASAAMEFLPQDRVTLEGFVECRDLRHAAPSIDIDAIKFDTASPTVRLDQLLKVQQIAQALNSLSNAEPEALFLIEGHADGGASDEFSLTLSEQRAEALKAAMVRNFGTDEHSVHTIGFGKRDLPDATEDAEGQNGRITLRRIDRFVRP